MWLSPLYDYTTVCLSILLLMDVWIVCSFCCFVKKLKDTPHKCTCGVCYLLPWGKYLSGIARLEDMSYHI